MRLIKTAWHHIRRSPYQAFAVIFIMTQTFFVITFFSFVIYASSHIIAHFESIPQVTAFFKNEAKQEDINKLQAEFKKDSRVSSVEFVSKEEGLQIYKEQNKDDPLLLEFVTADFLPSALKISTIEIEDLTNINAKLKKSTIVERIVFQKDVVETLTSWTDSIRRIGIAIIVILALDTILIMMIVLSIRISQKRDEIEIMRLLGATNWYVRLPFIYEGIFYGVVGAVTGWIFASGILLYATPFLQAFLRGIPVFPVSPLLLLYLLLSEILFAIILASFASFLAVLRYLK